MQDWIWLLLIICQYGTAVLFLGFWTSLHKLEDHEQALCVVMFSSRKIKAKSVTVLVDGWDKPQTEKE